MTKKSIDMHTNSGTLAHAGTPVVKSVPEWPEDKVLNLDAESLINRLPVEVRPLQLSGKFPRICNRIAELWADPEHAIPYFDNLLIDNRGGRNGFSLSIIMEISKLKEHFLASYVSTKLDVWKNNRNPL